MDKDTFKALREPFDFQDVDFRVQWVNQDKTGGTAVPYLKKQAIQDRLDAVLGPNNWKSSFRSWHPDTYKRQGKMVEVPSQLCGISLWDSEKKEWITKWDGAENTEHEPVKGGLSDAFKRAAVQWGVGRYLSLMGAAYVKLELVHDKPRIENPDELKKKYEDFLNKFKHGNQDNPKTQSSGPRASRGRETAAMPAAAPFQYDYKVIHVEQAQKGKNLYVTLQQRGTDTQVAAYLQGRNDDIGPGACLRAVSIKPRVKGSFSFNALEQFEIAA